jgi:hypothetical protein
VKLGAVETRNGFGHDRRIAEGHERKTAWLPRRAVHGQEDFRHVAHGGEECFELRLGRAEVEVADKQFCRNGVPPCRSKSVDGKASG